MSAAVFQAVLYQKRKGEKRRSSKSTEKLFEKAAFGYRPEEVDRYIEQMNAQIRSLEAEKADLLGKMKILAEKINEYRQDESNLKDALLGAQKDLALTVEEDASGEITVFADCSGMVQKFVFTRI